MFVVGSARSGTTLLQACLGAHPAIAAPPETHFIFRIAHLAGYYGDLTDDARLDAAVRAALDTPLLAPLRIQEADVLERARPDRTYAGLFEALMSTIAAQAGKPRWCDKTPDQRASAAWDLFPDARVVHIIRDPRDVAASRLRTPLATRSVGSLAAAWKRFNVDNIQAGAQAGPRRYLRVRYEDLVRDPEATLRLVCTFVEEDFEPAMIRDRQSTAAVSGAAWWQRSATAAVDSSRVGGHAHGLTRRQRVSIAAEVSPLLPALGYVSDPRQVRALGSGLRCARSLKQLAPSRSPRPLSPQARHAQIRDHVARAAARVEPEI